MQSNKCVHRRIDKAIKNERLFLIWPLINKGNLSENKDCCYASKSTNLITYCLKEAIRRNNLNIVKYLLDRNKLIENKLNFLPDYDKCLKDNPSDINEHILALLLDRGLDLNNYIENPIKIYLRKINIIKILLARGYRSELTTKWEDSVIYVCLNGRYLETLQFLLFYENYPYLFKKEIKTYINDTKYHYYSDFYQKMYIIIKLYKYKIQNLNMALAHEYDENSLFHRDYLCHDLFKQILESANIEYHLRNL